MKNRKFLLPLTLSIAALTNGLFGSSAQATTDLPAKDALDNNIQAANSLNKVINATGGKQMDKFILERQENGKFVADHESHASHASHSSGAW